MHKENSDIAYQSFTEWIALHTPDLREDEFLLEDYWSAITTFQLWAGGRDNNKVAEVSFETFVLSSTRHRSGMLSIFQVGEQGSLQRFYSLQAAVSASLPMQNYFEARIHEISNGSNNFVATFQSSNRMFRITGHFTGIDVTNLRRESLEASLANFLNGKVDAYAKKHCDCFDEWKCALKSIDISERLLLSARWAIKEADKTTNDPLLLNFTNLVVAGHGTNIPLIDAARRRRHALELRGRRIAAKHIANSVSIAVASSLSLGIIASINLKSGQIKRLRGLEEVWCLSLETCFPLEVLFQVEVCLAGFPISIMKSQKESRLLVDEKGVANIESNEGLFLSFSLLEGGSRCTAEVVAFAADVERIVAPWLSCSADTVHQSHPSEYLVLFHSVSFPFETVRSRLESLGIFEL